jgi:predicted nucleic acid-binding Zn finger protein
VPVDRMVEKAQKLLESGKVERLDIGVFNVVGDHGTYIVVESYDGRISCNCPGFLSKGRCSHSVAVTILKACSKNRHAR